MNAHYYFSKKQIFFFILSGEILLKHAVTALFFLAQIKLFLNQIEVNKSLFSKIVVYSQKSTSQIDRVKK